MARTRLLFVSLFILFFALIRGVWADAPRESNRAALVIDYGMGVVDTLCVEFEETGISGLELIDRSGLSLIYGTDSDTGAICNIEGTGCPATNCFCACGGSDCIYWSYWLRIDNSWLYSPSGAGGNHCARWRYSRLGMGLGCAGECARTTQYNI